MTKTYKGSFIEDIVTNTYGCNAEDDVALYALFGNEHADRKAFNAEIRAFCYSIAVVGTVNGQALLFSNINLGEPGNSCTLSVDKVCSIEGIVLRSNDNGISYKDLMDLIGTGQINGTNSNHLLMYFGYYDFKQYDFPIAIHSRTFEVSYAAACPEENEFELISEDNMEIDIDAK